MKIDDEPLRYTHFFSDMVMHNEGEWVAYEDYALLKESNARLVDTLAGILYRVQVAVDDGD
jgi:hypothetical protein